MSSTGSRFYYAQLDGLRFVAFLMVFCCHFLLTSGREMGPWLWANVQSGALGVDLFFVLSGFLITSLLLRERAERGWISLPAFWIRRTLRIWPLYFAFVLVAVYLERPPRWYVTGLVTFTTNWMLLYRSHLSATNLLWSVAIEEQFYLCWPIVLWFLPRRWLPAISVGMVATAVLTRVVLLGSREQTIWLHTFARLDPLAVGVFLAWAWHRRSVTAAHLPAWMAWASLAAAAALLVGLLWIWPIWPIHGARHITAEVWTYGLAAAILGTLLWLVLQTRPGLLTLPVSVFLGRISYGLYVFHIVVLETVERIGAMPWFVRFPLSLGLTVLIATLSYRFLEEPFLRLKRRFTYVRSAPVTVGLGASNF